MQATNSYSKTETDLAIQQALVSYRPAALEDVLLNNKANVADTYSKSEVETKLTQAAAVAAATSSTIQSEVSALQASLSTSQSSLSAVITAAASTQAQAATRDYVDQSLLTKAAQADLAALSQTVQMQGMSLTTKAASTDLAMAQQSLSSQITGGLASERAQTAGDLQALSAVVFTKASLEHVNELHSQQAAELSVLEASVAQKADADNVFTQMACVTWWIISWLLSTAKTQLI